MVITTGLEEKKSCVKIQFKGVMFGSLCCCNLERDYVITKNKFDSNGSMHVSVRLWKIHGCFWITAPQKKKEKNQL